MLHLWLARSEKRNALDDSMVLGHIYMANRDPYALRGMRTGYVSTSWAQREHKAWAVREIERAKATKGS